ELVERLLELVDGPARLRQEVDAGAGQRHLAGGAGEQLDAELVLELAHAMADRGLRQVEGRCSALKAAALGDAEEGLQAEEIDAHFGSRRSVASRMILHRSAYMHQIHQCMQKFHLLSRGPKPMSAYLGRIGGGFGQGVSLAQARV